MSQQENLSRVRSKIAGIVLEFCRTRGVHTEFHMEDLLNVVRQSVPDLAPDSPGRILRNLRQRGHINYRVVSRRDSLYEIIPRRESK